jgi:hypothetical protein
MPRLLAVLGIFLIASAASVVGNSSPTTQQTAQAEANIDQDGQYWPAVGVSSSPWIQCPINPVAVGANQTKCQSFIVAHSRSG